MVFFMLVAKKLSFARGRVMIFSNLSFQLQDGEILWLVGNNGAGKTTLLKLLLGRLQPTEGEVQLQAKQGTWKTTDADYHGRCFYLGHHHGTGSDDGSVIKYLQFVKKLWRGKESIEAIARQLQLQPYLTKKIKELSSGTQKKLQLAAMLCAAPQKTLWLLDEPFTALDKKTKQWLWQWLVARARGGDKIIFTSHDNIDADIDSKTIKKIKKIYL